MVGPGVLAGVAQRSKQTEPGVGYAEVDKAASGACSFSTALLLIHQRGYIRLKQQLT